MFRLADLVQMFVRLKHDFASMGQLIVRNLTKLKVILPEMALPTYDSATDYVPHSLVSLRNAKTRDSTCFVITTLLYLINEVRKE